MPNWIVSKEVQNSGPVLRTWLPGIPFPLVDRPPPYSNPLAHLTLHEPPLKPCRPNVIAEGTADEIIHHLEERDLEGVFIKIARSGEVAEDEAEL